MTKCDPALPSITLWICSECWYAYERQTVRDIDNDQRAYHVANSVIAMGHCRIPQEAVKQAHMPCDCCRSFLAGPRYPVIPTGLPY